MSNKLISSINDFIKKYHLYAFKDVAIFMIILLFFHFLWRTFYHDVFTLQFLRDSEFWLANKVFMSSAWILEVLHINVTTFDELTIGESLRKNVIYYAENNGYVWVNRSCSGLKQFYQWTILMLLYPGPWKHKLWFVPMGLLIIFIVNVFRIVGMTFVSINIPQHWDFVHDYVARPFFYVVIFTLWVWWNEKFNLKNKKRKESAT